MYLEEDLFGYVSQVLSYYRYNTDEYKFHCDQCIKIMRYDLFVTQLAVLIFFVGTSKIQVEPSK